MPDSLCVQTGRGSGKPGQVGPFTSMSNAWNLVELSKTRDVAFRGGGATGGAVTCSPARGEGHRGFCSPPPLDIHCVALGHEGDLGLQSQRSVKGRGLAPSSLPSSPLPPARLTTQPVICSFATRGDPVRDCRWSYARCSPS